MNLNIINELQSDSNLKMQPKYEDFDWCLNDRAKPGIGNRELAYSIRVSSVKSDEIRKFYLNKYLEDCLNTDENLKLSDLDTEFFEFDEVQKMLKIKNMIIKIEKIKSTEIKDYCMTKIDKNKDRSQTFLKLIKEIEYQPNRICTFNLNTFTSLNSTYQLHLMIYLFSSRAQLHSISNLREIFKQFSNNKSNLLDLINKMIEMNKYDSLEYILKNKDCKLYSCEYKKVKDYALSLRLFDIVRVLTNFESNDFILFENND